jgi:two-component system response regulator RpfG
VPNAIVIDDQSVSRVILSELVRSIGEDIEVETFAEPLKALDWVRANSVDLVLTDFKMPQMDGIEFTRWFRQVPACVDVPLVMITCFTEKDVRYRSLEAGATDFLTKPIDHFECRARCRNLLKLREQQVVIRDRARWLEGEVRETTRAVELREKETLFRLARAGEYRDEDTGNHVLRVARFARLIADNLGLDPSRAEILEHAAPMHDIGKIGIPDRILLKADRLTRDEWEVMKSHARIGYDILHDSPSKYLRMGAIVAHGHHERFDGSGYPQGLTGGEIPLEARITAVADVFDALCAPRPYTRPWSTEQAFNYLLGERGRQFDPDCVDVFLAHRPLVTEIAQTLADDPPPPTSAEEAPRYGRHHA